MCAGQKVFIAVSGGVDSAVSAAILKQKGLDCSGIFMITHDGTEKAHEDAQLVCNKIGIELHTLDLREDFEEIISYFTNQYVGGRTPNPCVLCNRVIKFGKVWEYAREKRADYLATGHYARIIETDTGPAIYQAFNTVKDQSYVLSMIDKQVLKHIILPMGEYDKEQTRRMAEQMSLPVHQKPDSQEICFIPDDDYAGVVKRFAPQTARGGEIIDAKGSVLGRHEGIYNYTIGQRRGLGIALGEPAYVVKIDAGTNQVMLGPKEMLLSKKMLVKSVRWLVEDPPCDFKGLVKIRYNHKGQTGRVVCRDENGVSHTADCRTVMVEFEEPVSAVTPGQAAVFYRGDAIGQRVLGAGWIESSLKD